MVVKLHHIGTATVLGEIGSFRFILDPSLGKAQKWYYHGLGAVSKKLKSPRISIDEVGKIDFALISHGQHKDNLDKRGRELLNDISSVYTTNYSATNIGDAIGLSNGDTSVLSKNGQKLKIHAVPAQHGLYPISWMAGPVIGFVLEFPNLQQAIYISGDTIYKDKIAREVEQFPNIKIFVPHLGNAQFKYLSGSLRYTMNATDLNQFLQRLQPNYTFPIHNNGWSHFNTVDLSPNSSFGNYTKLINSQTVEADLS